MVLEVKVCSAVTNGNFKMKAQYIINGKQITVNVLEVKA